LNAALPRATAATAPKADSFRFPLTKSIRSPTAARRYDEGAVSDRDRYFAYMRRVGGVERADAGSAGDSA
jgi:hypothetical protein